MKTFILVSSFIFLFFISFSQNVYYVQDTAYNANASDDLSAGMDTINPWATWQFAFDNAKPGDTVYFRGGVWYPTKLVRHNPNDNHGVNGTYSKPICFFNYPGEEPILDCINFTDASTGTGLNLSFSSYVNIRGLTVRNVRQLLKNPDEDHWIASMQFFEVGNVHLDRLTCYNGGGYGIWVKGFDTLYLINSDSYAHADTFRTQPGNRADGITIGSGTLYPDTNNLLVMYGCRAWDNSDDGIEISPPCQVDVHDNWVFSNGRMEHGAGVGIKLGHSYLRTPSKRRIYNNLILFNKGVGIIEQNLYVEPHGPVGEYSNNTIYHCQWGVGNSPGFFDCVNGYAKTIFRNNVVYKSTRGDFFDQAYFSLCTNMYPDYALQHHNTWIPAKQNSPWWQYNDSLQWTYDTEDGQWVSLPDSLTAYTILSAPRNSDGSLPDLGDYFKLAPGSDLIGAGVDVGYGYNGAAPDLGAFECPTTATGNQYPIIEITSPTPGSTFIDTTIFINAEAIDIDGDISKVEFFFDDLKIGEDNTFPYSVSWSAPSSNKKYSLRAVATDNQNATATSDKVDISISWPLSIEEGADANKNGIEASLVPNPNSGIFTLFLDSPLEKVSEITVSSINGNIVYRGSMLAQESAKQFDFTYLNSGIYVIILYSDVNVFIKEIIIE